MSVRHDSAQPRRAARRILCSVLLGLVAVAGLVLAATAAGSTSFTAATEVELVAAINAANAAGSGSHDITLTADISLSAALPALDNSAAVSITILGDGHTLSGDGLHTVLVVAPGTTAALDKLTILNGLGSSGAGSNGGGGVYNRGHLTITGSDITGTADGDGGGILTEAAAGAVASTTIISSTLSNSSGANGGALANVSTGGEATTSLDMSTISDNIALGGGGALFNSADTATGAAHMSVSRSLVDDNFATASGGAIANRSQNSALAKLTILRSTISLNEAAGAGGGLAVVADLAGKSEVFMSRVTFSGNVASVSGAGGGAIAQRSSGGEAITTGTNVTLSGNDGGSVGGALAVFADGGQSRAELTFATISDNTATSGNNLSATQNAGAAQIILGGSIVNGTGDDCALAGGSIDSAGFNVGSDATCALDAPTDLTGVDPLLQPLALNAPGETATQALATGSPAVDRITDTYLGCGSTTLIDQRGTTRRQGVRCDSGAYELDQAGILCVPPYEVTSDKELNEAILCINFDAGGTHNVTVTAPFSLLAPSTPINNSLASEIIFTGNGHEIDGGGFGTAFSIAANTFVTMNNMVISNGRGSSGASHNAGGGIYVRGHLTLADSTVRDSSAVDGGGIFVDGEDGAASAALTNVTLTDNEASRAGGGLATSGNTGQANVSIAASTISDNTSQDTGGGLDLGGYEGSTAVAITNTTISGNAAKIAGGIFVNGNGVNGVANLNLSNSTLSGNTASDTGGGLGVNGNVGTATADLLNVTVSGNSATKSGGAIINYGNNGTAQLTARYTTFSANTAANGTVLQNGTAATAHFTASIVTGPAGVALCQVLGGSVTSGDYNVISDASCSLAQAHDISNATADLGPLALNAPGTTQTHAVGDDSDALELIPVGSVGCGTTVAADQRAVVRPQAANGRCESGAYERPGVDEPNEPIVIFLPVVMSDK